jgi:acetyl-CoA synthetase
VEALSFSGTASLIYDLGMATEPQVPSTTPTVARNDAAAFLAARDFLLENRSNYAVAYEKFQWPKLEHFNWALDYFDAMAVGNTQRALIITSQNARDQSVSFLELSNRSNQVANFFRRLGISRGERILVMLGNEIAVWETMLAASKIGAVVVPTSHLISADDVKDRLESGRVRHVISTFTRQDKFNPLIGMCTWIIVGGTAKGWIEYEQAYSEPTEFARKDPTNSSDPLLLYFTSGTTAKPKLVLHSQHS